MCYLENERAKVVIHVSAYKFCPNFCNREKEKNQTNNNNKNTELRIEISQASLC
jgi:hypothetical protein